MTDIKRRTLLKGTLGASLVGIAAGAGLLSPQALMAAWPKAAFKAKKLDAAVSGLFKSSSMASSKAIKIKAPAIAESGAEVGVTISTTLPSVDSMAILIKKNNSPLAANFALGAGTNPYIRTRVKIAKTSDVVAVVRSGGKLFTTKQEVKVTIGGCGG